MSIEHELSADRLSPLDTAAELLLSVPALRRCTMLRDALTFLPSATLDESFEVGPLRAALAEFWEEFSRKPIPVQGLRKHLLENSDERTTSFVNSLVEASRPEQIVGILAALIGHLNQVIAVAKPQRGPRLFDDDEQIDSLQNAQVHTGGVVSDLQQLVTTGRKFATIYADPPWSYDNEASRGAAVNHYSTMSLDEICREPVADLAADNAHLHLWTTNAFLPEAFGVIDAWGFTFKSCFVWIKDDIGMGNYWRVSHEFLLLGVRGRLRFRDSTEPSWKLCRRTVHSRKPEAVRLLVEKVSPGPYLELYGRHDIPDSPWTVYGNQVERRLF